jgi:hypothetical protein
MSGTKKNKLIRFGFTFKRSSVHSARTIMLEDLKLLLSYVSDSNAQIGDRRDPETATQSIERLVEEVAYEHWHRMLFARFLAENDLLMYPDPDDPVPVTLEECEDLAGDEGAKNGWELAARFAARMLPQIFRPDSPVFQLELPPEHQQKLERLLEELPKEVFTASDSLGWVYQFWQARKKDEINRSEVKIGARELPAVTQLFTEPYMVSFLLDNSLGAWWAAKCDGGNGRRGERGKGIFETAKEKAELLRVDEIKQVEQEKQLENPDARVALEEVQGKLLEDYAFSYKGITTGDDPKFRRTFWDFPTIPSSFKFFQSTINNCKNFGGCESLVWFEAMTNPIQPGVYIRAREALDKKGVMIFQMRQLPVARYLGKPFDTNAGAVIPKKTSHLLSELLKTANHAGKTLETWLRDKFFAQHCKLFHHRPFIWHIWDGLRDGFSVLVNYHKLDRKNLETLIYTPTWATG